MTQAIQGPAILVCSAGFRVHGVRALFRGCATASGAIHAFSQSPLSRASRLFTGPILKGSKGSI
jgi:hypothetical protein